MLFLLEVGRIFRRLNPPHPSLHYHYHICHLFMVILVILVIFIIITAIIGGGLWDPRCLWGINFSGGRRRLGECFFHILFHISFMFVCYINLLECPIPGATATAASADTRHKNHHMVLHVAAAWYHRSAVVKMQGNKNCLTLSGPDVTAWGPEGRKGRSQEARRASS